MNKTILAGQVIEGPNFSHEIFERNFYEFTLAIARTSGVKDTVRCVIQEELLKKIEKDSYVEIEGHLASRKKLVDDRMTTEIYVYVNLINAYVVDINTCEIFGTLKANPYIRNSKKDGKTIAEFNIASKRNNVERLDYIPCIAWMEKALEVAEFVEGDPVHVVGRIQSRCDKRFNTLEYEVSIPRNGEFERWEM